MLCRDRNMVLNIGASLKVEDYVDVYQRAFKVSLNVTAYSVFGLVCSWLIAATIASCVLAATMPCDLQTQLVHAHIHTVPGRSVS